VSDLWAALGLVLVLEGAAYALFPGKMRELLQQIPLIPVIVLRIMGITAVAIGWVIVWLVRH
jgi:uncharacterized protein